MISIVRQMARFTKDLNYEDLSEEAINLSKRFLLDSIGCAYGSSQTEDVEIMCDFYNEMGGKAEASVFNSSKKLPMVNASLLNSLMIRALDYNDIYWEQDPSHPSDIIPAALTPAEVLKKSGKDLIVAIVLAYEWEQRLCEFAIPGSGNKMASCDPDPDRLTAGCRKNSGSNRRSAGSCNRYFGHAII